MVSTVFSINEFHVVVTAHRETGESVISVKTEMQASDAADFFTQALGYFRFAVQEMDVRSIEVEMFMAQQVIERTEITRD